MTRCDLRSGAARAAIAALTTITLLTAAACGGGDSEESTGSAQETSSSAPTTSSGRSPEVTSSTARPSEPSETVPVPSWNITASRSGPQSVSESIPPRKVSLSGTDPCTLLTEFQREELGLNGPPSGEKSDGSRSCEFTPAEGSDSGSSALLAIHENSGLDGFTGINGDPKDSTISGHPAKIQCEYGNCRIGIAVTESSRVDVQSTVRGDDAATEELGRRIAKMVIGNLANV